MDVTVFNKYGDSAAAKRCFMDYSREELVTYINSRWSDLSKDSVQLLYHLRWHGELSLHDKDDMLTIFALMLDRQLQSINVIVTRTDGQLAQSCRSWFLQPNFDLVDFGGLEVVDWTPKQPAFAVQYDPRLRSEEWHDLVLGVGHSFPDGVVEFRKE